MNAMHNFKIGQCVYVPVAKAYYYINGIKQDCYTEMFGSEACSLYLNKNPNTATRSKGTIKLSSRSVEIV